MRLIRLLTELKRRHVYQVAAAYVVAGFAVLEAADLVLPALTVAPWVYRALVITVLAGFPVVVVLAWIFDLTPEGLQRDGAPIAGEDGDAAGAGAPADGAGAVRREWSGRPLLVGTVIAGAVGVAAWLAGRSTAKSPPSVASGVIAVAPFVPAAPDSALERLGRELVITLSSALASTADLDVVEPLTVLSRVPPGTELTVGDAGQLAASLGAADVLYGGLIASGDGVRVEMGLYEVPGLRRVGSAGITAGSVDALTDSATLAALRLIWAGAPTAPPSPGAVSTGSLESLQAYLDGEGAVAEGRWREAPEYFARAVAADSGFWFAYWRLQYALQYHGSPVDSVIRARVWEHRRELPERDRLLIEARAAAPGERLALLQEATTRFPTYWPAWWDLADLFVHRGGYLGHTLSDSRAALERTLALNPRFVSAWSHLFWIATAQRDTASMTRIIDELSSASYDETTLQEAGINALDYYRAQLALARAGEVPASVVEMGVSEISGYRGPDAPEDLAGGLTLNGFLDAQIRISNQILRRHTAPPPMERAQHFALAHAWAGKGRWDSALVAADAYAASATRPADLLVPYQFAVVGAWAGALPPEEARSRRPGPRTPVGGDPELAAGTAWLDGLLALTTGDAAGLARARSAIDAGDSLWPERLVRTLDAFRAALAGDSAAAGHTLVDLERTEAEDGANLMTFGAAHPFVNGVRRLTAARWLLADGDTVTARRLLPWYEMIVPTPYNRLQFANQVLAAPALRLRWALAEAAGRDAETAAFEARYRERRGVGPGTATDPGH